MKKILAHIAILSATAFDNKAGWKTDADGKIEAKDGNPIWVDANGGERVMQANAIETLNSEAKTLRTRAEKAEGSLKAFEGLDAAAAKDAIEKLSKIDQKTLIDAGKVDEVKQQITSQFTAQIAEKDKAYNELQTRFDNAQIAAVFAGSQFIRESIAVPPDMFEATFKSNFKIENGKINAYDRAGNPLMSKQNIGQYAEPEEALSLLVEAHPQRDTILKASGNSGTGNDGKGGTRGGSARVTRAEFNEYSPAKQAEIAGKARAGELTIVD